MLTAKAQYSAIDAERYFKEHLSAGDYYTEQQRVLGQWHGQGAADLGLAGVTKTNDFVRLCENLHPQTGEKLTLRQKTTRTETGTDGMERETANRWVFYDFTISPPKSVSIAALVGSDERIVEAHDTAVIEALQQLQSFASTRVRKNDQCTDRNTGNFVAAVFRHDTSRALDPHLHSHCILFNAMFDSVEKQWKALQNHDMLAASKFVEKVYYHALARELVRFGYQIENKPRGDFEIVGIAPALIEKFSKRHKRIDEQTRKLLERSPEKAADNLAVIRENIAHRERPPKVHDLGSAKLRALWNSQMTPPEMDSLWNLTITQPTISNAPVDAAEKAVAWAQQHLFERRSVVQEHEVWRHALERTHGQNVSLSEIQAETKRRDYVRFEKHPGQVSTRDLMRRECEMVWMARSGIGERYPFIFDYRSTNLQLDAKQREAVEGIIKCSNSVILFRGGAGTGKTFTLREVQREIQTTGRTVHMLAPQRQQVMDLEREGFQNTRTVSAFLVARPKLTKIDVLLVDEAGQIGGKQMHALLELAMDSGARVILSGDTRQHGAVEATDALRAIEKHGELRFVELRTIRRQNPARANSSQERERISVTLRNAWRAEDDFDTS
jgi:conjugative relaxase-like TrwC/TraI family protein